MAEKIFISYRRDADGPIALLVYYYLLKKGYDVFIDVESLRSGDVRANLEKEISYRQHFVIVLSPEAVQRLETGDDKDNWLLKELKWAIKYNRTLIPFFRGFDFKTYGRIPTPEMEELKGSQGVEQTGPYILDGLGRLSGVLPPANQWCNRRVAIAVGCVFALAVIAWGGINPPIEKWTEITRGFNDTQQEVDPKHFEGSLSRTDPLWTAYFTEVS